MGNFKKVLANSTGSKSEKGILEKGIIVVERNSWFTNVQRMG